MNARIAALLAFAFAIGGVSAAELEHEEKWVGAVALPYPSGVHELSGTCVGAGTSGDEVCRISIHVLRDEQSHIRTLLATRELRYLDGSLVGGEGLRSVTARTPAWTAEPSASWA